MNPTLNPATDPATNPTNPTNPTTIPAANPKTKCETGQTIPDHIRSDVMEILRNEAEWDGPFPTGGLAHHLDSMQRLALVVAIEDHFEICFEPEDEQRIHDFDDLLRSVAVKVEERK